MLSKITICKPEELGEADRNRWSSAQSAQPVWNSPFLHPEFARIVARRREDVRVLIAEDHLANRAWFAFHRLKNGLARPVGAPVSDHQGMVSEPGFIEDVTEVLFEAGIGALPFSSWSSPTKEFLTFATHNEDSHILDLSSGPDQYFAEQQQQHHKYFKKMRQRARGVIRDYANAEFRFDIQDQELLERLFQWKHDQHARTHSLDVLHIPWVKALLENAYASTDPGFRAVLFGYKIGGEWAAAELGLLAGGVYHSWIAAYDEKYSRASPGLLLLHGVIEQADKLGIKQIDLGRGHSHYKKYYASSLLPLHAGCLIGTGRAARHRKLVFSLCDGFAKLPLGKLARLPGRLDGSLEYIGACHPARSDQFRAFGGAMARVLKNQT